VLSEEFVSLRRRDGSLSYWVSPVQEAVSERVKSDDGQEQASGAHGDSIGLLVLCGRVGEFQVDHSRSDDQRYHQGVPEGLHEGGAECGCVYYLFGHGVPFCVCSGSVLVRLVTRCSRWRWLSQEPWVLASCFERLSQEIVLLTSEFRDASCVAGHLCFQLSTCFSQLLTGAVAFFQQGQDPLLCHETSLLHEQCITSFQEIVRLAQFDERAVLMMVSSQENPQRCRQEERDGHQRNGDEEDLRVEASSVSGCRVEQT